MTFFEEKPTSFTWGQIHRIGSAMRKDETYDEDIFTEFSIHCSHMCEEVRKKAEQAFNCLINKEFTESSDETVHPDTRSFRFATRVKTVGTLTDKLKRMSDYPLENIQDMAGVRLDCDMTLTEQTILASIIQEDLKLSGVKKVTLRDLRESPHSGYRAIHLHLNSTAGKAELQIRTALQSKWANLYEVAADIYGRPIRYAEFGESIPEKAKQEVNRLKSMSDEIYNLEQKNDDQVVPFTVKKPGTNTDAKISQQRKQASDALDCELNELREARKEGD